MQVSENKPLILIAEGIEKIEQVAGLAALGYQYVQGYAFDKPTNDSTQLDDKINTP